MRLYLANTFILNTTKIGTKIIEIIYIFFDFLSIGDLYLTSSPIPISSLKISLIRFIHFTYLGTWNENVQSAKDIYIYRLKLLKNADFL